MREISPRHRRPKERVYQRGHCCWCGRSPLPPRRRDWCSDRCVREFLSFEPRALRQACFARDGGFCRGCGRDLGELERRLLRLTRVGFDHPGSHRSRDWVDRFGVTHRRHGWTRAHDVSEERARRWRRLLRRLRVEPSHLWEADHKIPVVEGGLNCLANLRTLCVPCHKAETRKLAARRAQRRRSAA